MKVKRRLISFILSVVLVGTGMNIGFIVSLSNVYAQQMTLQKLRDKFPHESYWNHVVQAGHGYYETGGVAYEDYGPCNNPNGVTWTPCDTHNGIARIGGHDCNSFDRGIQCLGFALKCAYDIYGESARGWTTTTNVSEVKPGDVLTYYGYDSADDKNGHTVFVIERQGNNIKIVECNNPGGTCQIRWDREINIYSFTRCSIKSAPYEMENNSDSLDTDINMCPPDVSDVISGKVPVSSKDVTVSYDGVSHGIEIIDDSAFPTDTVITWSDKKNGQYKSKQITKKNAGTYTIYWKATNPHYTKEVSGSSKLKIKGIKLTAKVKGYRGEYDGEEHGITITDYPEGTKVFYRKSVWNKWSGEPITRKKVGSTTVFYKLENKNAKKSIYGSVSIVIKKKK